MSPSHLDTLRAIVSASYTLRPWADVDSDLAQEAGMDGGLRRLLQAARDLDEDEAEAEAEALVRHLAGKVTP